MTLELKRIGSNWKRMLNLKCHTRVDHIEKDISFVRSLVTSVNIFACDKLARSKRTVEHPQTSHLEITRFLS